MGRPVSVTIVGDASKLERTLTRVDGRLAATGRAAQRMQTVIVGALAGGAIVQGVGGIIRTFEGYDTALRDVGAVSNTAGRDLDRLGSIARRAGLETGVGATEATKAMAELAKAGLSTRDIGPALKGTLQLAQAGGLGTAEAAEAAANALGSFKLRGSEATSVADQFANAANLTTADVGDFAMAMSQGASAARTAGLDFGETNLALTMLARNAVKGSDAGTSLKAAITQLAAPTDKAKALAKDLGLNFFTANGEMKDVADISDMLNRRLGGLSKQQQLAALTTLAGTDGQRALGAMMGYTREEAQRLERQLERQGSAAKTADAKQAGFAGSMNKLRASAQELGISLGDEIAPDIARFAERLTDIAGDPEQKARIVGTFASFVDGAEDLWHTVEPGVELVGDLAGAFADLPGPVKASVVQLGALALVASKLKPLVGLTGVGGGIGRMRRELDAVPAASRRAAAGMAAVDAANARSARAAGRAATPTFTVPAGALGTTGMGALNTQQMSRAQIDDRALGAQREQSTAARNAVRARQALAAAEAAEANAARRAIGARAVPRTAATRGVVAAAEAQLVAARQTTVAAREASVAAAAESTAARRRLTAARGIQSMVVRAEAPAAAAATGAAGTRGARALAAAGGFASRNRAGLAIGAGAGGIGAALSGGSPVTAALSGAALGSMAGPIGAAAGALVGGGVAAMVGAFNSARKERAKRAAETFARGVTGEVDRAMASGLRREPAQRLGRATATLDVGRQAVRDFRRGEQLQRSDDINDRANGIRLQQAARSRANAAGLDIDALRKGTSNAYRKAGQEAVAAFSAGIKANRFTDARTLMARFTSGLGAAPPEARKQGAQAMLEYSRALERQGRVAKGTTDRLARDLSKKFGIVIDGAERGGRGAAAALDRALRDNRLSKGADDLQNRLADTFQQLPRAAVRSVPGAVAVLGSQLDKLKRIAADKNAPKEMRDQAKAALPELRREYDRSLGRMAKRLGISKDEARDWSAKTRAAAKRAGNGVVDIDSLKDAVGRLNTRLLSGKDIAKQVSDAWREAGGSARDAAALGAGFESLTNLGDGLLPGRRQTPPGNRRGGTIRRFSTGGMVPAMVSSGEEIEFGGRSFIVPGPRVAADNVGMMLPVGAKVWTEDSQIRRAAGEYVDVNAQVPHFRTGGPVQAFARGGFVSTSYGPPWNAMNGTGVTRTGLNLRDGKPHYVIAVDPSVIPLKTKTGIWPNPFGYRGKFSAEDTGGAIRGKRIDFYDWRGRAAQTKWGRRNVAIDTPTSASAVSAARRGRATEDQTFTETVRRSYGRSRTRGGLLDDAFSAGFEAVNTFGSRRAARRYGNPVGAALREALDAQRDSYSRSIERTIRGVEATASGKQIKSIEGRLGGTTGGRTKLRRLSAALGEMQRIAAKGLPYTYGGGHGRLGVGNPGFDCSGYVSAGLGAAGWISRPMATQQGSGLNTLGASGAGRFLTWGVRGSSGRNAHTMMKIGSQYFESGSGHGPRRVSGWAGKFAYRHMPGYRTGGTAGRPAGGVVLGNASKAARAAAGRAGAFDPRSSEFVGWGLRRGGRVRSFVTGGLVGYNPFDSAALDRLPGHRPSGRTSDALAALAKSTAPANVDAFTAMVAGESMRRLETMRRELLRQIRGKGDKQKIDRLRSAVSIIETDVAGRIAEGVLRSARELDRFEGQRTKAAHARALEGIDDSSAMGLRAQIAENDSFVTRVAPGARDELVTERERTKRELAKATSKEARATLAGQLTDIRGKIKDLDGSIMTAEENAAAARRALPRQAATERTAGIDLADALASLTAGTADDRAALAARVAEGQRQMGEARATGDNAWLTEAAGAMKNAADALRDFDDNQRQVGFNLDAALAALTEGDADDRAVLERQRDDAQRRLDESLAAGDRERATQAAIDLKNFRDALSQNTAAQEEANQLAQARMDLDREILQATQRVATGQDILARALPAALARMGTGIATSTGPNLVRAGAVPGVPGRSLGGA